MTSKKNLQELLLYFKVYYYSYADIFLNLFLNKELVWLVYLFYHIYIIANPHMEIQPETLIYVLRSHCAKFQQKICKTETVWAIWSSGKQLWK